MENFVQSSLTSSSRGEVYSGEKPNEYSISFEVFNMKANLTQHKRIHIRVKAYECNDFGKAFKDIPFLRNHVKTHTEKNPLGIFNVERPLV